MDWQNSKNDSLSLRRDVLGEIRRARGISRAALAAGCGMTRPTVSSIVSEFIGAGLVRETGKGASTGGKRPIMLALADEEPCAIGIAVGDDYVIRGVTCDLSGRIRDRAVMPYSNRFESIRDVSIALVRQLRQKGTSFRGVGIAVSGVVDPVSGEVRDSHTLDLRNRGLAPAVARAAGLPVYLETRSLAAALAEAFYGAGRQYRDLMYLSSGRGIGAGIVIGGKLFRGSHGAAGELGDVSPVLDPDAPSLESRLQAESLTRRAGELLGRELTYAGFLNALAENQPQVVSLVHHAAEDLAEAVHRAVALLDPEAVVLGGQLLELGPAFFDRFRELLEIPADEVRYGRKLAVCPSELGEFGGALGGATVILERLFQLQTV